MNSDKGDNKEAYIKVFISFTDELHLSGLELLVYSLIYGFCTQGTGRFNGSLGYIARRTGSSNNGVRKALSGLIRKGLVKKESPLRKGKDMPVYTVTYLTSPPHPADGGDTLSGQEEELSSSNIKEKIIKTIKNQPDHLDMTRSELCGIMDADERKACVYEFAYLFSQDDCDNASSQYVSIVALISEMVVQPSADYIGESVTSDSVWAQFVLNLREDTLGLSIRDFIFTVISRLNNINIKDVRSLKKYIKAVIWRVMYEGSITEL